MKEDLIITEEKVQGAVRFFAKGRIDATSADVFDLKLENAFKDGQINILVNMSQVEYLSSIGIRVILKMYKKIAEAGGKFNIERPSENVRNVLGMVALKEMMID